MERLSGLDASFLYLETETNLMNVCGLLLLDGSTVPGGYSFEKMRAELDRHARATPAFRRMVHDSVVNLDHPVWVDDPDFDIDRHLHRVRLAAPGARRALAQVCGEIAGTRMDRGKPLWEMWVVEGLESGEIAVISKMHHATVDGVTAASLVAELCALEPDGPPLAEMPEHAASSRRTGRSTPHKPGHLDLAVDGLARFLRRPLRLVELVPHTISLVPEWVSRARRGHGMPPPFVAPRTGFNAPITGSRAAAFASLDLTEVKRVKDAFGVKVNDLVLTVCSGALRRYLAERDGLPDTSLVAMVPVSMHGRSDRAEGTNKLSGMFHSLASDIADPVERLRAIASHSHAAKEHHRTLSADLLQDWAQFAPPVVFGLLMRGYSRLRLAEKHPVIHNLVISNVPGPQFPVYFLGARVRGFFPFGPIFDGAGLNITVISREGGMDFGLLGCADLVPDIGELADAIPAEFAALRAAADRLSAVTRG